METSNKKNSDDLMLTKIRSNYKDITKLEEELKHYFSADNVTLWFYNPNKDSIFLPQEKNKAITLDKSLIKECIEQNSLNFYDHLNSNKYYSPKIDNPLNIKLKSMMIFPIVDKKEVLGVLILYKNIRRGTFFTKKDAEILKRFSSVLIKACKVRSINVKNHYIGEMVEKQNYIEKKKKNIKVENKKPINDSELALEVKVLKNTFKEVEKENIKLKEKLLLLEEKYKEDASIKNNTIYDLTKEHEILKKTYENTLIKSKNDLKKISEIHNKEIGSLTSDYKNLQILMKKQTLNYNTDANTYKKEITILKKSLNSIEEKTILEYEKKIEILKKNLNELSKNKNLTTNKQLENELKYLNTEIEFLEKNISKLEEENEKLTKKVQAQFIQPANKKEENTRENNNIEYIIQTVDTKFHDNKYALILFELLIHAFNSEFNMKLIDEKIAKTKLIPELLDEYDFDTGLKIYEEKHVVSDFIANIKKFEKKIFHNPILLHINLEKLIPETLVFDAPKLQTIFLHLLRDLDDFSDMKKPIEIDIKHDSRFLYIEMLAEVREGEKSLFGLGKKNIIKDISKRHALQFGRMLLYHFGYDVNPSYVLNKYRFSFKFPIKLK